MPHTGALIMHLLIIITSKCVLLLTLKIRIVKVESNTFNCKTVMYHIIYEIIGLLM